MMTSACKASRDRCFRVLQSARKRWGEQSTRMRHSRKSSFKLTVSLVSHGKEHRLAAILDMRQRS